jgi:hypothetical protein
MEKIYIILISIIIIGSCKAQKIEHNNFRKLSMMDTVYNQQHNQLRLTFVRESDKGKIKWKSIVKDKNGEELIVYSDSIEKNMGWEYQESIGESPADLYNIAGSYLEGDNLYVTYNRFGEVFIIKYSFTEDRNFTKQEKLIEKFLVSAGFGDMVNKAQFIKIDDYIYMILNAFQSGSRRNSKIFKIDQNSLSEIKIVIFSEKQDVIQVCSVSNFGKSYYQQIKDKISEYNKSKDTDREKLKPTKTEYDFFEQVKDKINKNLFYIKRSGNGDNELPFGIEEHTLFLSDNKTLDYSQMENADKYIKEVLSFDNKNYSEIQTRGYIHVNSQEKYVCFFYTENTSIKIIKYDLYNSEWVIGDYKEEEVKIE